MNDKKRLKNIWKKFRTSGIQRDIEEHPERHTFEFSVDEGVGWEYVSYSICGKPGFCRVSYIGPAADALAEVAASLEDGRSEELVWLDEPGEYRWFLSRKGECVYVEAPGMEEGYFLDHAYFVKQLRGC